MQKHKIIQDEKTTKFIEAINKLVGQGVFKNRSEVVNALNWDNSLMSLVMLGKRNVPLHIIYRFRDLPIFKPTGLDKSVSKYSPEEFLCALETELIESFGGLSIDKNGKETHVPYMVLGIAQQAIKRLQPKTEAGHSKPVLSEMEIAGILTKRKKTIENGRARINNK